MATSFDRWEKDPFFSAAEEVQDSADRMESGYRAWLHSRKEESAKWASEELCRDLRTAVGTTKWQLEEFERAVTMSYATKKCDDARERHREFILAVQDHVSRVENSLNDHAVSDGKPPPSSWVRLDEGERNELALFLSGPPTSVSNCPPKNPKIDEAKAHEVPKESTSNLSSNSTEFSERENPEVTMKLHGHRRTASASADIGSWKIAISDNELPKGSSDGENPRPPRKTPSLSVIFSSIELPSVFKHPRNGARKWKMSDIHQESETKNLQQSRGMDACYEKSKTCLDGCDECYDKQLYGWYGAIQRQLQRSQYQMQYNRAVQVALSASILFLIVFVGISAL